MNEFHESSGCLIWIGIGAITYGASTMLGEGWGYITVGGLILAFVILAWLRNR